MRIQHNLAALNAYRQLGNNNSALSKNLEKLSSGYRINRAGDDAAGLAISEKMRAQIKGLEAAQKNANDGISLVQTAEGALTEVHSMLNRMTYLATQSANGTYDDPVDRANLQAEVDSLLEEIDRISQSTNFNGLNLLDGSMDSKASKVTGGEQIDVPILQQKATNPTDEVGTRTVLHSDNVTAKGTEFEVYLHNTEVTGQDGDKLQVTIGDDVTLEIAFADTPADATELQAGTAINGEAIAAAIKAKFDADGGTINGQAFTATATKDTVKFTQDAAPTSDAELVDADLTFDVTLVAGNAGGNAPTVTGPTAKTVTTTDSTNTNKAANVTFDLADFEVDRAGKVTFGVAGKNYEIEITQDDIDAAADATDPGYVSLAEAAAGKLVTAINADKPTDTGTDNAGAFTAALDGDTGIKLTAASATNAVKDATLKTALAADITIAGDAGYTQVTLTTTGPTNAVSGFTDGTAGAAATLNFDLAGFDTDKAGKVTFTIGGKAYDIEITAAEFAAKGTTSLDKVAAGKLAAALNADKITDEDAGAFTAANTAGNTTITLTAANNAAVKDTTLATALGANITAAEKAALAAQVVTDPADKTSTFADQSVGATAPTIAFDLAGFSVDAPADVKFTIGGKDYTVTVSQEEIDAAATTPLDELVAGKLVTAMNANKITDADAGDFTANATGTAITLTAENEAAMDDTAAIGTTMTVTATAPANTNSAGQTGTINVATGKNVQGNIAAKGNLASTTFSLTADIVKDGQKLTIGEDTYTFKVGAESKVEDGEKVIDLSKFEEGDAELLNAARELLSRQDNSVFTIGYDNGKTSNEISIHEKVGNDKLLDDLQDVASFDKLVYANKASETTPGATLSLQVGDTADEFNKVTLDIKDMSTKGLDIEGLSIATQKDATDAIAKIKAAINTVSAQRGDLGAVQNRLEHTINNLGVQAENITAAESRIRDTDMAEEMMAYTKNNILVQAAQAMLAQANQVPQGILQLLQ